MMFCLGGHRYRTSSRTVTYIEGVLMGASLVEMEDMITGKVMLNAPFGQRNYLKSWEIRMVVFECKVGE